MCAKKMLCWLVPLLVLVSSGLGQTSETSIVGQLVLKMADGYDVETVTGQYGAVVRQHLPQLNVYQIDVGGAQDLLDLAADLRRDRRLTRGFDNAVEPVHAR